MITDTNTSGNPAELKFDVQGNYFNLISSIGVNVVGEGNAEGPSAATRRPTNRGRSGPIKTTHSNRRAV